MNLKEIKGKIKKEKRKRNIKKMGKKLASSMGFVATVSMATAALLYVNSDDRGQKELKQAKKTIKEIHGITEEVKEYIQQNAREIEIEIPEEAKKLKKEIPKEAKKLKKEIPKEAKKFEKELK